MDQKKISRAGNFYIIIKVLTDPGLLWS